MTNHKERRTAAYQKLGLATKAEFAKHSGNRSRRARGKMRQAVKWGWRGPGNNRFEKAKAEGSAR